MNFLRLFVVSIFFCFSATGQPIGTDSVKKRLSTARTYIMVLLEDGKNKPTDDIAYTNMVLNHLGRLYELQMEGKILAHGQVLNDSKLTAMILFNTHDEREAKKAIDKSELVQKGYMTYRTFRWFGEPGQFSIINNHK